MSENVRLGLILSFHDIRPSFLAAIDQIVAEMRPKVIQPGFYAESVLACANAFADPSLVRDQLAAIAPEVLGRISEEELLDAHLASVSYLFSLALHELMRKQEEVPQP